MTTPFPANILCRFALLVLVRDTVSADLQEGGLEDGVPERHAAPQNPLAHALPGCGYLAGTRAVTAAVERSSRGRGRRLADGAARRREQLGLVCARV